MKLGVEGQRASQGVKSAFRMLGWSRPPLPCAPFLPGGGEGSKFRPWIAQGAFPFFASPTRRSFILLLLLLLLLLPILPTLQPSCYPECFIYKKNSGLWGCAAVLQMNE